MVISAVMATYPARRETIGRAVASLLHQVDALIVVANNYAPGELDAELPAGVSVVIPPSDLKDTGKFFSALPTGSHVLLCDDDIVYPADYVRRMSDAYGELAHLRPIIGVHGVVYSDFFDGSALNRQVSVFNQRLERRRFVNQLGTGTVFCHVSQMPDFAFMESSARFVDLRFAVHCHRQGFPRVCIEREGGWLTEIANESSVFETFTKNWPADVVREAQSIAGFRRLPPDRLLDPR